VALWSEVCYSGDCLFPEPAHLGLHPAWSCPELCFRAYSELFPEWGRSAWSAESAYWSCPELFPVSHYPEPELQYPALGPRFPESVQPSLAPVLPFQAESCPGLIVRPYAMFVPHLILLFQLRLILPIPQSRRSAVPPSGPELHWFDDFVHSA
jgi:hypothetical protein